MIAHEIAHYLHGDSGLLLKVRSYLKAAVVSFYYQGIMFAVVAAIALFSIFGLTYKDRAGVEGQLLDLEKRERDYRNSIFDRRLPFEVNAMEWEKARLERELHRIDAERISWLLQPILFLAGLSLYALFLLYLRRRVQRSEEVADLFASVITHPNDVARFLTEQIAGDNYGLTSLYPQIDKRVALVKSYATMAH
jgi:Zn-dependent protease with chaperone function